MSKKRLLGLLFVLMLLLSTSVPAFSAGEGEQVTVLFTHDLHSHLLPANDENGVSYGGYARLKTVIDEQKAIDPDALLVDAGDFSMGSLFQAVFATDAAELRIMGAMGYDVTTFGNHEYDYRAAGLAGMLNAALDSGEELPAIVEANYKPPLEGEEGYTADSAAVWDAFDRYGVEDYLVIERGGVNFAVFGIIGKDGNNCAPMSGMVLADPIETARKTVATIEAEVAQPRVVVCLSHSGTWADSEKSEDEILAKEVDGIDLIVSGHTHTTLHEPIAVEDTYIVSAGEYSKNLGVVRMDVTEDGCIMTDYELIPINDTVTEDPEIAAKAEDYKKLVENSYLSQFGGLTYDEVLATNPYSFGSQNDLGRYHRESTLGNLITDSYRWAVEQAEGEDYIPVDFAVTATGVIRESLPVGELTVSDVFNVSSLGIGADGVPGYPLVSVWLTGKDLKNAFEVDASVSPLMDGTQLYASGATYTFNPNRMLFNKVTDSALMLADGSLEEIEEGKLYRIVTGLYCGQMLGLVNEKSFGLLSITPRDAEGNEITDLEAYIVHNADGSEVKEWYALAAYLRSMGTVSEKYSAPEGRKVVEDSMNPVALLKNPNGITLAVLAIVLVLILLVGLIVRFVIRRCKKKKNK